MLPLTSTPLPASVRAAIDPKDPALPMLYLLTVSTAGPGTVIGSGISCPGDCVKSYSSGSTVTLTARKGKQGWIKFRGWSGACTGKSLTCIVTMTAAQDVGASFGR